ncbi:MAG: acyl carrier protein [Bacteroidales bacterium]|nr:acyl carrier protein [Bacteroidales bacterium]MDD7454678.1 acyl carrier protein [Bacteroidales bacterium]MDY2934966.1 acyl carrier protein [Candidatus Cryptobacteroides sp.]MDY6002369.1 acyl carrier protein [Candidatus Cryptobacteroides sp.]
MEKAELIQKINAAMAEEFEVEESVFAPEADIKSTLELDSLSLVDLVALVESNFGIKINGADIAKIRNFGALYDLIYEKVQSK